MDYSRMMRFRGELPEGCKLCAQGAKLVLLVTGLCNSRCFYCPLSEAKRNRDVTYANERPVKSPSDVLEEARLMDALGAGITGGDPFILPQRTARYIEMLKDAFGRDFHIHLYTMTPSIDAIRTVADAGLDEIRFHIPPELWSTPEKSRFHEAIKFSLERMHTGIEVPLLPDKKDALMSLIDYAESVGVEFINLNELEFSETNYSALLGKGYVIKDDVSSAALGCDEVADEILNRDSSLTVHYCSSSYKDAVQLKNRILRRAKNVAKPYEIITDDATLLRGELSGDVKTAYRVLVKNDVPEELIEHSDGSIYTAPWIVEELKEEFPDGIDIYLVEYYPTWDALEVEREKL